jgi:penicillin-binding protein 1A
MAAIDFAQRLGISTPLAPIRPLVLGASCVIPAELARAIGTFAEGGRMGQPIVVVRARNGESGQVLFDRASPWDPFVDPARRLDLIARSAGVEPAEMVDPQTSFLITTMMSEVVKSGTGHDARAIGRPAAGKTGTTNNNTDAWFVGFTGRVVAAVWIGFDDPRHVLGPKEDGAHAAVPLWTELVAGIEATRPKVDVPGRPPPGIVSARVDRETGFLARPGAGNAADYFFRAGTVPTQTADEVREIPHELDSVTHGF